jgi:predicted helicase
MPINVLGFQTHRDHFAIDFEEEEIYQRILEMRDDKISDTDYYTKYGIKDNRDWKLTEARQNLRNDNQWKDKIITCLYRPFDWRYCYFSTVTMDYPRRELINHVAGKENVCINTLRQTKQESWQHSIISNAPTPAVFVEIKDGSNVFPLYLYPDSDKPQELQQEKRPNFSLDFLKIIEQKLGYLPTPEAIFYYIYGIFHSPTYRTRYAEFLKIDFPRVPLTINNDLFIQLSNYGEQLVKLHLMESPLLDNSITQFIDNGGNREVEIGSAKTAYKNGTVKLNKQGDCFTGVPEEVWNFYVGGYQVCHKWLKDRKKRTLSDEDINHYHRIVVALQETIKLMSLIDEAIPSFPIE